MDRTVTAPRAMLIGLFICLLSSAPAVSEAQTFFDPTRPVVPAMQSAPADAASAPQVGVAMVVTAKEGVMALMDGRILRVGSRIEDGVVVRITSDALFVRSAKGVERRVPLYPEVRMTPALRPAGDADRGTGKFKK